MALGVFTLGVFKIFFIPTHDYKVGTYLCLTKFHGILSFQIRDYHRRHPVAHVVDAAEEYEAMLKEEPHIDFSGEV